MVSNLSLSEKLQSRLSRSFHASRALRFVPKSLRFLFWNFRKRSSCFSSCPSSFHLPEASRLPFAGFLCYEIFMVRIPFGISSPALGELFYSISFQAVCQELFFLFFSPLGQSQSQRVLIFIFFLKEQFLYPVYIMLICHNKPFHWLI